MFNWRFINAMADEAVRAYQQLTGNYSLSGAASPLCQALDDGYMMGGEL